jgi:small subunit ribosomal protein S16
MVVIRLSRGGSAKSAFYHIMVADRRKPRDGRFIECVGYYNPVARGQDIRLKLESERIQYWISKGAKATERVMHLINELQQSPEKAQQAAPRKGEQKRQQAELSAKAQKKAEAEKKAAEESKAAAAPEAAAEEAPKEEPAKE